MGIKKKSRGMFERSRGIFRIKREIHTISSGISYGGESNSVRKAYAGSMHSKEVYSLHRPMKAARMETVMLSFSEKMLGGS